MGRKNSIESHPARMAIDHALDRGEPYSSIVARFGNVSTSSISRYALQRSRNLANSVDPGTGITDLVARYVEAADDARELRRQARVSASPPGRARAIRAELEALDKLSNSLGITDTTIAEELAQVRELVNALSSHARTSPDSALALIETLRKTPNLQGIAGALASLLPTEEEND